MPFKGGGWRNNPHCLRVSYGRGNFDYIRLYMVEFRCALARSTAKQASSLAAPDALAILAASANVMMAPCTLGGCGMQSRNFQRASYRFSRVRRSIRFRRQCLFIGSNVKAAIAPVAALLLSVALLLTGNGLQGTLLPIRGQLEDFSTLSVGLIGSFYFVDSPSAVSPVRG